MLEFRVAVQTDLDAIANIENAAGFNHWNINQLQECLENNKVWILLNNNTVITYAVFSVVLDESELLNIVVLPAEQSKGFAKQLLQNCINQLSQLHIEKCFLEVARSNAKAISLYEKLSFKKIAERKNYYITSTGTEDALVMQLQLGVHNE